MICQQCQTELREGARFCGQCATPVPEPQASPVSFEGVANWSTIQQSGTPTMANVGVRETHAFDLNNFWYWEDETTGGNLQLFGSRHSFWV